MNLTSNEKNEQSLAFGGQAVMEGVMIRSKDHLVISVRQPNDEIVTKSEKLHSLSTKYGFLKLPFIRGIFSLFETLYAGVKGISFSANAAFAEEDEKETLGPKEIAVAVVLAVGLSVLLFFATPFALTTLLDIEGVVFNIVEGVVRLAILLAYMVVISLFADFKRIFQYHGAEHAAINTYEAGVELNVENAREHSRFHARCGTSFLLIVAVVSIVVFSLVSSPNYWVRLSYRILLIPVISSLSYELLRISGKYKDSLIMRILIAPGIALQHFTTRPPDDKMLEVALTAVKEVLSVQKASE